MSEAYKCDRCGDYYDDKPDTLHHDNSPTDCGWSKDLCHGCYHGLIEYLIGMDSETANKVAPDR